MRLNECDCPRTYACAGFILEELWILTGSSHSRIPRNGSKILPRGNDVKSMASSEGGKVEILQIKKKFLSLDRRA